MNLKRGDRSNTVKYLQQGLRMLCINPNGTDGIFGAGTETAVKKFQSKNGLSATGIVNDATWNAMKKQIIPIQNALIKAGYNIGTADGVAGDKTYSSVLAFQKKNGLTADGMVGAKTMQLLKEAGNKPVVLQLGSKGTEVKKVQERLIALGYSCGTTGADGDFGQGTYNAVVAFQKRNGLTADGKVGEKTREKLFSSSALKNVVVLQLGSKGAEVKKVQERLIALGYSCGTTGADGDFGQGTYNAVVAFQKRNGLTADGKVGENTRKKLFSSSAIKNEVSTVLKEGSKGSEVKKVQERLIALGYSCGSAGADGDFGKGTYNAVVAFQKKNGLTADGIVGEKTREKLFSNSAVKNDTSSVLKKGASGEEVKKVQERLIALGYSCGSKGADGYFGTGTYSAVYKFQRINGLTADGIVGEKTRAKLFSSDAKKYDSSADTPIFPNVSETSGDLLKYTCDVIIANEGGYDAINTKADEIITIGAIQWNGDRAYKLLVQIREADTETFDTIMDGTTVLKKIKASDMDFFTKWEYQNIPKNDVTALKKVLKTNASIKIQDELTVSDVTGYLNLGKKKGISSNQILIYFADCYNQSPGGIDRIGGKISEAWNSITLEELHNYASNDIYTKKGKEYGLGLYKPRRNKTYEKAKAFSESNNVTGSLKEMVNKMIDIALAEEKADRYEGLEQYRGLDNYNKYLAWFPYKQGSPWCACFVSWCANKAGLLNIEGQLGLIKKTVAVQQHLDFYIENERFASKDSDYIPQRGDVFILKEPGTDVSHVGFVTGYDASTKTYSTIEGNTDDDTVKQKTRSMNSIYLTGFGRNTI